MKTWTFGFCALLRQSFNRLVILFKVTMLWVLLLPYLAFVLGFASNQAVLIANHDKFPVMLNAAGVAHFNPGPDGLIDKAHCVMTNATHLNALADIFDGHDAWYSIGDYLIDAYEWLNGFCIYVWIVLVVNSLVRRRHDG